MQSCTKRAKKMNIRISIQYSTVIICKRSVGIDCMICHLVYVWHMMVLSSSSVAQHYILLMSTNCPPHNCLCGTQTLTRAAWWGIAKRLSAYFSNQHALFFTFWGFLRYIALDICIEDDTYTTIHFFSWHCDYP